MVRRIEGQRLDVALQRLRDRGEISPLVQRDEFRAFFHREKSEHPGLDRSAEALLNDFIMPLISDAGIFQDGQTVSLLEYLRDEILPLISEDGEVNELATKVIDDEIARHSFVRERRQSGIAV